jgi:hypothetical protein
MRIGTIIIHIDYLWPNGILSPTRKDFHPYLVTSTADTNHHGPHDHVSGTEKANIASGDATNWGNPTWAPNVAEQNQS